jgi:hypothetical protein
MAWLSFLSALYFLFGATMYMGTMWVLKLFLYPTWRALHRDNVGIHFGLPTLRATRFFTGVVPLMFLAAILLVVQEWGTSLVWWAVTCLVGIVLLTGVGQLLIIPVNKKVRGGDYPDDEGLRELLVRWMLLNDIRFWGSTVTWIAIVGYLVVKTQMWDAF